MFARKSHSRKKVTSKMAGEIPLDSSLTPMDWLPKIQIGENPVPSSSIIPSTQLLPDSSSSSSLPISLLTTNIQHKIEAADIELPTSTVHTKPPYSYVTLIRQAILGASMQRMTLNEIYQWILDTYPYFRTASPKWKNSIRHNLSLNKCFKRLQRSSNDPGKGSYWAVDESNDDYYQSNSRRRKFNPMESALPILPSSPNHRNQQSTIFYSNNNPMFCSDVSSVGEQSSSADESDSTMSFGTNSTLIQWDDLNIVDLTASFHRFREQVLDAPPSAWMTPSDTQPTSSPIANSSNYNLFPHGETNSFFESMKLTSHNEINWNDVDVKPYCEFSNAFRTNSSFQQQDRDKLANLPTSLYDYTGITNFAQHKIANESIITNRLPITSNRAISNIIDHHTTLPIVLDGEDFDWDSIT
ncbi:unnamed protein product [Adineta steineri]|uniref:Fork-head domain-containing protein n=1 Tax=Adineta steineri TaxID=433720 RepID=A0A815DIQ3_9BILA|nr:unnamed protein product [Adineta steineri]